MTEERQGSTSSKEASKVSRSTDIVVASLVMLVSGAVVFAVVASSDLSLLQSSALRVVSVLLVLTSAIVITSRGE
jgi:protein-S-isoprenylcysteine O-methyltransferase Ste14